jgi:hypothetical protein
MRRLLAAACVLTLSACSGSTSPTPTIVVVPPAVTPTPPPAEIPAAPVARLSITVDGAAGFSAIAGSSTVAFDASASSGSGLRYGFDFGDGQGVDAVSGSHVYSSASKVYKVRLIVTDSLGRTDQATADVTVKSITGSWSNSIYNANARRSEYRVLNITKQDGTHVDGQYTHPEGWTTAFSGDVSASRGAALNLVDGTVSFTSDAGNGFNSDLSTLSVKTRGGSADGLVLTFTRYNSY